jgi:hypothetical protein
MAGILLFVPPPNQCPEWQLPDRAHTPLLPMFLFWTVTMIAMLVFLIVRWNWAVQKAAALMPCFVAGAGSTSLIGC